MLDFLKNMSVSNVVHFKGISGEYFVYKLLKKDDKKVILTKTVVKIKPNNEDNYIVLEGLKNNDVILLI